MCRYAAHVFHPLAEGFELAVGVGQQCRHLPPHLVHLERREHLVGMAQRAVEVLLERRRRRYGSLRQSLDGGLVDDAQYLAPHGRLKVVGRVEAVVYLAQECGEHLARDGERRGIMDVAVRAAGTT